MACYLNCLSFKDTKIPYQYENEITVTVQIDESLEIQELTKTDRETAAEEKEDELGGDNGGGGRRVGGKCVNNGERKRGERVSGDKAVFFFFT